MKSQLILACLILVPAAACRTTSKTKTADAGGPPAGATAGGRPGMPKMPVFIQPFESCKDVPSKDGSGKLVHVCANNAISGSTEEGYRFADIASCDVVRTQRPFTAKESDFTPNNDDPRLQDKKFMTELAWVTAQIRSSGCSCCHDSSASKKNDYANWNINAPGIWTDQWSTRAIGLFSNKLDATTLGAYPADKNHGFDRSQTGAPTNDVKRMQAFIAAEIENRGLTDADFVGLKPLGGPLVQIIRTKPAACQPGVGIDASGKITWPTGPVRYVYVLKGDAEAPIVPPNLDLPNGTLWRIDVPATGQPVSSGITYGVVPAGMTQRLPEQDAKPEALVKGQTYRLHVLPDVPVASTTCLFTY